MLQFSPVELASCQASLAAQAEALGEEPVPSQRPSTGGAPGQTTSAASDADLSSAITSWASWAFGGAGGAETPRVDSGPNTLQPFK